MTDNTISRYAKMLYALEYKGRYCVKCGLDGFEQPWLMDLHHRDPSTKKFEVKNKIYSTIFSKLKDELDKCDLLCTHCHRKHHSISEEYIQNYDIILKRMEEIKLADGSATRKPFDLTERKYMLDNAATMSRKDIAKNLNREYGSVSAFMRTITPEMYTSAPVREKLPIKSIVRAYEQNRNSLRFLAQKYDTSTLTIRKVLTDEGCDIRQVRLDNKSEIIKLISGGMSDGEISKNLGVDYRTVWRIRKNLNDTVAKIS